MRNAAVIGTVLAAFAPISAPARAEVASATPGGFEVAETVTIDRPIEQVWDVLRSPQKWWDREHTYSGDSANLYLDPQATGCFCEKLPGKGSIEHARVIYVQPPRALRLSGALGPLQVEGVSGSLSFVLKKAGDGTTELAVSYVVGGYFRQGAEALAPVVDKVLGNQVMRLKQAAEAAPSAAGDAPAK